MYVIRWFPNLTKFLIFNFEVQIFVIVYFQLLITSLKLKKREFDGSTFFVEPKRDLFSQLKKENKYSYFKIQNLVKLANH